MQIAMQNFHKKPSAQLGAPGLTLMLCAALLPATVFAQTQTIPKLNDTGIALCYDDTIAVACSSISADSGTHPRQDGRYGRDAKAAAGTLSKIGAGSKGFDFTKICNNGNVCATTVALGTAATDWGCTRDNVTGLIWEMKTAAARTDLRHNEFGYTWYSTNAASNGGDVGTLGTNGTCNSTLTNCNTESYVTAVNAALLCNASDWRMPNPHELRSIVDYDLNGTGIVTVDADFFPNTFENGYYWTGSTFAAGTTSAWVVMPSEGARNANKSASTFLRLVRGGQ